MIQFVSHVDDKTKIELSKRGLSTVPIRMNMFREVEQCRKTTPNL